MTSYFKISAMPEGPDVIEIKVSVGDDAAQDEKQPFWCNCAECGHEFAPFYTPISVRDMPKDYRCPKCRSKRTFVGRCP